MTMETDLFFGGDESVSALSVPEQLAAAGSSQASLLDALPTPLDAAQVVIPEGQSVVRIPVLPGEVIVLPFGSDVAFAAKEGNGHLAIRVGDVTIILEGYVAAAGETPPV